MTFLQKYFDAGLEAIPCNLCRGKDAELLASTERFGTPATTVICRGCGLIYLNPRWTSDSYARFYEEDYRRLMGETNAVPYEMMLQQRVHGARIVDFCRSFLREGARILDIGCAAGGVLSAFRLAGKYELTGLEPSLQDSAFVRERLGIDVKTGGLENCSFAANGFDLAILTQTLNHMLDPFAELLKIRSLLAADGMLFLEVQNYPEYAKMTRRRSLQIDHTYYFAPQTLECMVRRVGFEPIRIEVDTAAQARSVHPFMWNRSASIHIRLLVRKAEATEARFPDYQQLRKEVLQALKATGWRKLLRRLPLVGKNSLS